MAGDHKCPVCQATFTRPQHVARHMRSHTGDRPYRCQHCGDQFARSDLLSRHVNKCHPGEKPLSSTAPARRKGSSSATRATTSKQACDQCVQSSLPCDGANPCSKCIHRKCRCTFVKFHRQTAPLGPGHPSRPNDPNAAALAAAAAASGALPGVNSLPTLSGLPAIPPSYRLSDSFLLAPNAPAALAAGSNPNPMYANHQFNFSSPAVDGNGAPNGFTGDDYASRYRAQAEFLSRNGILPGSGARSDGYPQDLPHDGRYAAPYPREIPQGVDFAFTDGKHPAYSHGDDDPQYGSLPSNFGDYQSNIYQTYGRPSTGDSSHSTDASGSLPSSASSSSIHLPLPNTHPAYGQQHQRSESTPSSYSDSGTRPDNSYPADGEGGFSSAFGLMSLDDPAVLAGLSEGVPFFDQEGSGSGNNGPSWNDGITPRPGANPGALGERPEREPVPRAEKPGMPTPSNLKELKDMWKAYMRTPLTGPQLSHSVSDAEANPSSVSPTRGPKRERTIPRVASLPSVKTPDINAPMSWDHIRAGAGNVANQAGGRGSVNNPEDLRSYEQAVLARRTPMTLNLAPKKRMGSISQAQVGLSMGNAPAIGASMSRPSSSSSTSSLAQAFGDRASDSPSPIPLLHPAYPAPPPAVVPAEARPGFKRLPSQTLGPEYSKRTAVAVPPSHGESAVEDDDGAHDGVYAPSENGFTAFPNGNHVADGLRLPDRTRRMSAPVHAV